jgi:PAN domain
LEIPLFAVELVELCKGYPIVRHPQKTLLGFALTSKHAPSFIECLELCFINRQTLPQPGEDKQCKSVMYFYEERTGANCILNFESKETAPAYFVDENEVLVDYASFENCYHIAEGEDELVPNGSSGEDAAIIRDATKADHLPSATARLPLLGTTTASPLAITTIFPRAIPIPSEHQQVLVAMNSPHLPQMATLNERMVSPPKAKHPPTVGMLAGTTSSPAEANRLRGARKRWRQDSEELELLLPTPGSVARREQRPSLRRM